MEVTTCTSCLYDLNVLFYIFLIIAKAWSFRKFQSHGGFVKVEKRIGQKLWHCTQRREEGVFPG